VSAINEVLELLSDGNWHNLAELSKSLKMPYEELDSIIHFLSKYGFVDISDDLIKVKMEKEFEELVTEKFKEEPKETKTTTKQKPPMLMTIKGEFRTIQSADNELVVTGNDLEIEEMKKQSKELKLENPEMVNINDLMNVLKLLTDNEWHHYGEITSRLQFNNDKLLGVIKVLRENDLIIVHDKFGMFRLRQEIKIQQ